MDPTEEIFTQIHKTNAWGGNESVSGPGSGVAQTRALARELPKLFREFGISSILDIPCGDFHWMKGVDLGEIDYIGGDIVQDLVRDGNVKHGRDGVRFEHLNVIEDDLPKVDLVFCRDCLVHFSFDDIFAALGNICRSESTFLLTTTFTNRDENRDIPTGRWRTLNLQIAPLKFPEPLRVIDEECTDWNGAFPDKAMGLWRISELASR